MKKIGSANISFGVPLNNWTASTVYAQYKDNDSSLFTKQYYVMTTDLLNVYKCLSNNGGAASTIKPTGTSTASFTTSDGYVWRYMYTLSATSALNFLTPSFMPVQTIASNDGSAQWAVQQAAVPGSIEVVEVDAEAQASRAAPGPCRPPLLRR